MIDGFTGKTGGHHDSKLIQQSQRTKRSKPKLVTSDEKKTVGLRKDLDSYNMGTQQAIYTHCQCVVVRHIIIIIIDAEIKVTLSQ